MVNPEKYQDGYDEDILGMDDEDYQAVVTDIKKRVKSRSLSDIPANDPLITHLLGYLTPDQWRDALRQHTHETETVKDLVRFQEYTYGFNLWGDIVQDGDTYGPCPECGKSLNSSDAYGHDCEVD